MGKGFADLWKWLVLIVAQAMVVGMNANLADSATGSAIIQLFPLGYGQDDVFIKPGIDMDPPEIMRAQLPLYPLEFRPEIVGRVG